MRLKYFMSFQYQFFEYFIVFSTEDFSAELFVSDPSNVGCVAGVDDSDDNTDEDADIGPLPAPFDFHEPAVMQAVSLPMSADAREIAELKKGNNASTSDIAEAKPSINVLVFYCIMAV